MRVGCAAAFSDESSSTLNVAPTGGDFSRFLLHENPAEPGFRLLLCNGSGLELVAQTYRRRYLSARRRGTQAVDVSGKT